MTKESKQSQNQSATSENDDDVQMVTPTDGDKDTERSTRSDGDEIVAKDAADAPAGVNPEGWRDIKLTSVTMLKETVAKREHQGMYRINKIALH